MKTRLIRLLSNWVYGLFTSAAFSARHAPQEMRRRFELFASRSRQALRRKYPNLIFEDHNANGVYVESIKESESPRCVILYLHGGAFLMGSVDSYRGRMMRIARRCDAEVFLPEYRLAPEHPYPAALDDTRAAYEYVNHIRPETPIFIAGDSAGGGLTLSLLISIRDDAMKMPCGAFAFSPWADLTQSGASIDSRAKYDRWLTREHLNAWAEYYCADTDPGDPLVSPVFSDLSGLPPILLFAGGDEILLDDARRCVDLATDGGGCARLHIGENMQHDWPLTLPWLNESRKAWREIEIFVNSAGR